MDKNKLVGGLEDFLDQSVNLLQKDGWAQPMYGIPVDPKTEEK